MTPQTGFTMVELIMVMILIGVLSAVAMPRLGMINGFDESGYRDQVIAALDFARKSAVAQRRNVQVTLNANALSFRVANDAPEGAAALNFGAGKDLLLPGSGTAPIAPRGNNTTLAGPATLVFTPLGAALAATYAYAVTGETSQTLSIDPGSGYVY